MKSLMKYKGFVFNTIKKKETKLRMELKKKKSSSRIY
jgi:hypothetical protein